MGKALSTEWTSPCIGGSRVISKTADGNRRRKWTPAEDLELQRYFAFGCYTSAEIAEKLGRKKLR